MRDFLDDELQQMNEREFEKNPEIQKAVSIKDPISTLVLQKMVLVEPDTTIAKTIKLFQDEGVACVLVTENGKLAGIFTERDVIRKIVGKKLDHTQEVVSDYMTPSPDALQMEDPVAFALNRMYDGGYRHVPIVDKENRPVGIVGILDIITYLGSYYSEEVLNLPPDPMREPQTRPEGG